MMKAMVVVTRMMTTMYMYLAVLEMVVLMVMMTTTMHMYSGVLAVPDMSWTGLSWSQLTER